MEYKETKAEQAYREEAKQELHDIELELNLAQKEIADLKLQIEWLERSYE